MPLAKSNGVISHQVFISDNLKIDYSLRRARRKTMCLQLDEDGVRVAAPYGVSLAEIEGFLSQHRDWLQRKLAQYEDIQEHTLLELANGVMIPVFGEEVRLVLVQGISRALWRRAIDGVEEVIIPSDGKLAPLVYLERSLSSKLLNWLQGRVEEYAYRLDVKKPLVRISRARKRWGSCSIGSGLRFNWRLVHLEPRLIEYVVAHEVAHLLEMNHSDRFWQTVARVYPDYSNASHELGQVGRFLPRFSQSEAVLMHHE